MQHSNKYHYLYSGFSLIELTIIIVVISLLAILLIIGVNFIKTTVNEVGCGTNLRQLGSAMWGYAEEHQGRLPGQSLAKGYPTSVMYSWQFALNHEYFGEEFVDASNGFNFTQANSGTIRWMASELDVNIPGQQLWCPSFEKSSDADVRAYRYNINLAGSHDKGNQYGQDVELTDELAARFDRYHLGVKIDDIKDQSEKVMVIESNTNRDHFDYLPYSLHSTPLWTNQWAFRHKNSTYVLFADGHSTKYEHANNLTTLNEQAVRLFGE